MQSVAIFFIMGNYINKVKSLELKKVGSTGSQCLKVGFIMAAYMSAINGNLL